MEQVKAIYEHDTVEYKSFEQILKEFKPLIKSVANKYWKFEDREELATIYLWQAYEAYDNRGFGFAHFAKLWLNRNMYRYNRDYTNGKRYDESISSLDYVHETGAEAMNLVADKSRNIELKIDIQNVMKKLTPEQKRIVYLLYIGTSQNEIARINNTYQVKVFREVNKIRSIFSKELN